MKTNRDDEEFYNWNASKKLIMRGIPASPHYFISISLKFARLAGFVRLAASREVINSTRRRLLSAVGSCWNWKCTLESPMSSDLISGLFYDVACFSRYHCRVACSLLVRCFFDSLHARTLEGVQQLCGSQVDKLKQITWVGLSVETQLTTHWPINMT